MKHVKSQSVRTESQRRTVHRMDDRVLPSAGGHLVLNVVNPDNPRATSIASEHSIKSVSSVVSDKSSKHNGDNPRATSVASGRSTKSASSVVSDKSSKHSTSDSDSVLMESMNKLIKAQSDMLTVQTQAVAIQGLPPLKKFSGDVIDSEENSFE